MLEVRGKAGGTARVNDANNGLTSSRAVPKSAGKEPIMNLKMRAN